MDSQHKPSFPDRFKIYSVSENCVLFIKSMLILYLMLSIPTSDERHSSLSVVFLSRSVLTFPYGNCYFGVIFFISNFSLSTENVSITERSLVTRAMVDPVRVSKRRCCVSLDQYRCKAIRNDLTCSSPLFL